MKKRGAGGLQESLTNGDNDGISSFALTQISNEKLSAKNFGTSYKNSTNVVNQQKQHNPFMNLSKTKTLD